MSGFSKERLAELAREHRRNLLEDTLPFWIPRAVDREHGGFLSFFDRDGTLLDTDKSVWVQGRFGWLLGRLSRTLGERAEWDELCAESAVACGAGC